jgi:predicted transposase YdaD
METDSFFCQLFKYRPETLFELLGEPSVRAKSYRFDSVELKKSFRIDGLYLPRSLNLPLCFVEVQFQSHRKVLCKSVRQGVLLPGRKPA